MLLPISFFTGLDSLTALTDCFSFFWNNLWSFLLYLSSTYPTLSTLSVNQPLLFSCFQIRAVIIPQINCSSHWQITLLIWGLVVPSHSYFVLANQAPNILDNLAGFASHMVVTIVIYSDPCMVEIVISKLLIERFLLYIGEYHILQKLKKSCVCTYYPKDIYRRIKISHLLSKTDSAINYFNHWSLLLNNYIRY